MSGQIIHWTALPDSVVGWVWHFGKYVYLLSNQELDDLPI